MRRSLRAEQGGGVLILFALSLLPLLLVVGTGVDYLRMEKAHQDLQVAVEAAAFAGARALDRPEEEQKRAIQGYFIENWWDSNPSIRLGTFSVNISKADKLVHIRVQAFVPLFFMRLVGISEREIYGESAVKLK
jgi:Flp pilus assembly protein TadG